MTEWPIILHGDLSIHRLPELLHSLESLWDPYLIPGPLCLDLADVGFIFPAAITLLTTAVIRLKQKGFSIRVEPPRRQNVHGYLNRIDFYELLGMDVGYPWQRHAADGRFREVIQVQTEKEGDSVVTEVMEILDRNLQGVSGIYDAAHLSFLEIVGNVFHHAHSPTHAVICAQLYPKQGRVELAVADSGRGIAASLQDNPALQGRYQTAAEAIALAVGPRTTGRPEHNSGEGLFFTTEFIKANGGDGCIHSHDGALWVRGNDVSSVPAPFWPGTLVALCFRTDRPVDTGAIFDRHAPADNDFD